MHIHFIAIGGSAMHNLALALSEKGYTITGSDDEINEPSKTRLANAGLLPEKQGWFTEKIISSLDAVILGMHAHADNPELKRAKELNLKIFSYPEYLYEQTKDKTRVVIGGSHGKTTITSMIIHVLNFLGIDFDFMVGAQLEGFDNMVRFNSTSKIAVFEGDEYLSSTLDPRPKFHLYRPNIALISGIAWDHINVFPTFDNYVEQFQLFIQKIETGGYLVYCTDDAVVNSISRQVRNDIHCFAYSAHPSIIENNRCYLLNENERVPVQVFGEHNMQNLNGARKVCNLLGVSDKDFYDAIRTFKGAAKRLQLLNSNAATSVFLDFAHAPSKVIATVKAVKEQFPERELVACFELHTYSSLNENFLSQYNEALNKADAAIVYFSPHAIELKRLAMLDENAVKTAFGNDKLMVFSDATELAAYLKGNNWHNKNLLLMSSGNFGNLNLVELANAIVN